MLSPEFVEDGFVRIDQPSPRAISPTPALPRCGARLAAIRIIPRPGPVELSSGLSTTEMERSHSRSGRRPTLQMIRGSGAYSIDQILARSFGAGKTESMASQ
jgi:hypothetical protein